MAPKQDRVAERPAGTEGGQPAGFRGTSPGGRAGAGPLSQGPLLGKSVSLRVGP